LELRPPRIEAKELTGQLGERELNLERSMPMKLEEVRGLLIKALKQPRWNQVTGLEIAVGDLKAQTLGLQNQRNFVSDGRAYLEPGESSLIHEAIWSFIVQGIIVPGLDDNNKEWPFIRLTDYGRRCIEKEGVLPHDPDRYLDDFRQNIPNADPVIVEYLTESLQCFLRDLQRAAAVMLGAASEKAVLLLIDSYVGAVSDPTRKGQTESQLVKAPSIYKKFEVFEKGFPAAKADMPKTLTENTDSLLRGVFDLIRNSRNEAGHPASGGMISRDTNYSHLRLFIPYCLRIYGLISWFSSNSI
jgi:hypothetical protein